VLHGGGGAPFIAARGGRRRQRGGGNRWVGKWRQRCRGRGQGGGYRCLKAVGAVRMRSARGSDREANTRGPHGLFIIPELSKLAQL
jgi:hypothetical protein